MVSIKRKYHKKLLFSHLLKLSMRGRSRMISSYDIAAYNTTKNNQLLAQTIEARLNNISAPCRM